MQGPDQPGPLMSGKDGCTPCAGAVTCCEGCAPGGRGGVGDGLGVGVGVCVCVGVVVGVEGGVGDGVGVDVGACVGVMLRRFDLRFGVCMCRCKSKLVLCHEVRMVARLAQVH